MLSFKNRELVRIDIDRSAKTHEVLFVACSDEPEECAKLLLDCGKVQREHGVRILPMRTPVRKSHNSLFQIRRHSLPKTEIDFLLKRSSLRGFERDEALKQAAASIAE